MTETSKNKKQATLNKETTDSTDYKLQAQIHSYRFFSALVISWANKSLAKPCTL